MNDTGDRHPTIEVRIFQYGELKACTWCASADEATDIAAMWRTHGHLRCEIVELGA